MVPCVAHPGRHRFEVFKILSPRLLRLYTQLFSFAGSGCWPACSVTGQPWQNSDGFGFLFLQKQGVKSSGALSREARKPAWRWRWGTGWPGRPAGSPRTAAWTATAPKESEWGRATPRSHESSSPCSQPTSAFPGSYPRACLSPLICWPIWLFILNEIAWGR